MVVVAHEASLPVEGVWTLDAGHSTVWFRVKHRGVAFYRARFLDFEATFDAASGSLTGAVETASLEVFDMLKEHLLSDEFLAAKAHPRILFAASSIVADGDALTVDGDLTLAGVQRPVRATGRISGESAVAGWEGLDQRHIGLELTLAFDRRDFGVDYNAKQADGQLQLGWDVEVELWLEFATPISTSGGS